MLVESKYKVQYCGFRAFNRGTVIIVMLVSSWAYDGGVCVCVCVGGGGGGSLYSHRSFSEHSRMILNVKKP